MRKHDGGFLSQPGAQRINEVNPRLWKINEVNPGLCSFQIGKAIVDYRKMVSQIVIPRFF